MEERDQLGSEAEDGDESLDGEEDLRQEDDDEVQDLVDIGVGDGDTSGGCELVDNLGEGEVHVGEGSDGVVGAISLGGLAALDSRGGLV